MQYYITKENDNFVNLIIVVIIITVMSIIYMIWGCHEECVVNNK